MGLLSGIFGGGSKVNVPDPVQVDATKESQKAIDLNKSTASTIQPTLTDLTSFFTDLFQSGVSDSTKALDAQNRSYISDLQTGYGSTEDQNFINQQVAEGNLSSGFSKGSQIGSFNKGRIWRDKIAENRAAGFAGAENIIQRDQSVAMSLLQPAQSFLNANLVTPGQFLQTATTNANSVNEANVAKAVADSQQSGIGGLISGLLGRGLGALAGSAFGPIGTALGGAIGGTLTNKLATK